MSAPVIARYPDVLAAVRNFVLADDRGRRVFQITHEVAAAHGWDDSTPRLEGQVRRALGALAASGVVVKRTTHYGSRVIWVPKHVIELREQRERERELARIEHERVCAEMAAAKIKTDRWAMLYDRLARHGIEPPTERGKEIALELDQWNRLLNGRSYLP